jgi:serine/threonine protein kinase
MERCIYCRNKTFEVHEKIGRGSYGNVYRCIDKETGAKHAMKEILFKKGKGTPCVIEIAILSMFDHPNLAKLEHRYASTSEVYLIQPLADMDLQTYLTAHPPLVDNHIELVHQWFFQLSQALSCLHKYNIIHGDIKPGNVLVYGNNLKLADFTLSMQKIKPTSRYHHVSYTITYRSPEVLQIGTTWSSPADVWALGCVFHEIAYKFSAFVFQGKYSGDETKETIERTLRHIAIILKQPYEGEHTDVIPSTPWPDSCSGNIFVNKIILKMIDTVEDNRPLMIDFVDEVFGNMERISYKITKPVKHAFCEIDDPCITDSIRTVVEQLYSVCSTVNLPKSTPLLPILNNIALKISGYSNSALVRSFYADNSMNTINELRVLKHVDFRVLDAS